MRVTEHRLLDIAGRGNADARRRAAEAGEELSTGVRVRRASDDPIAWARGARAASKGAVAGARMSGIERALERLAATDTALDEVSSRLHDAYELAIQMSNGTVSPGDRAVAAERVQGIIEAVIETANARGVDGAFLFAGSRTDAAAFDSAGLYAGDGTVLEVSTGPASAAAAGVAGSDFDPIAALVRLRDALATNSGAGLEASVGELAGATARIAVVRATVGFHMERFEDARDATADLELRLSEVGSSAIASDPIDAATRLAGARSSLETSRALADAIASMLRR
jgi:flagellin-like hook-associated protein FlgL